MNRAGLMLDWKLFFDLSQDRKEKPEVRDWCSRVAADISAIYELVPTFRNVYRTFGWWRARYRREEAS